MTYPVFASGDVLNASDMNAVGLWLVKTQTVGTAVASVTVNDAFSANYDNYLMTWTGGAMSTSTSIELTLGGSTTQYYQNLIYGASYGSSTVSGANKSNAVSFDWVGGGDATSAICVCYLFGPFLTEHTFATSEFYQPDTGGGLWRGVHKVASSYTSFTLDATGAATMTGGTIRVYGLRN